MKTGFITLGVVLMLGLGAVYLLRIGEDERIRSEVADHLDRTDGVYEELEECLFGGHPVDEWHLAAAERVILEEGNWWKQCAVDAVEAFDDYPFEPPTERFAEALSNFRYHGDPSGGTDYSASPADVCHGAWELRQAHHELVRAAGRDPDATTTSPPHCDAFTNSEEELRTIERPTGASDTRLLHRRGRSLAILFSSSGSDAERMARYTGDGWERSPLPEGTIPWALTTRGAAPVSLLRGRTQRVAVFREGDWQIVAETPESVLARHALVTDIGTVVVATRKNDAGFYALRPERPGRPLTMQIRIGEAPGDSHDDCDSHIAADGGVRLLCPSETGELRIRVLPPDDTRVVEHELDAAGEGRSAWCDTTAASWLWTPDGTLLSSTDEGLTWSEHADPGERGGLWCRAEELVWIGPGPDDSTWASRCSAHHGCTEARPLADDIHDVFVSADGALVAIQAPWNAAAGPAWAAVFEPYADDGFDARRLLRVVESSRDDVRHVRQLGDQIMIRATR